MAYRRRRKSRLGENVLPVQYEGLQVWRILHRKRMEYAAKSR